MLAIFCSALILAALANVGVYVVEAKAAHVAFTDASAVLIVQGVVIACAVLMLQNVKLGFLVFLALQAFEAGDVWLEAGESADLLDLDVLLPLGKAVLAGFFLFGGWNT